YLKMFIELGFYGYTVWVCTQYILYTIIWKRTYTPKTACVYMCVLMYMSVTFMTDNTAFSYWSTMALRLLPMAFASGEEKTKPVQKWRPPSSKEMEYRVRELYNEKC
ncbi:MAG: O-antigen ligase domain-containing protein, partial [Monoglobaceae bacterium]